MIASSLTVADLERIVHQTEPAALLVPPRILRRVIKQDRHLGGLGLQVPHRKSYVLGRDALLDAADRAELGLAPDQELPATVLLLPLPDPAWLAAQRAEEALLEYWRLLFHVHVHLAIARRRADGRLSEEAVCDRIARIGATEFDEVRVVLKQEHYLLPATDRVADATRLDSDAAAVYEEFVAVFLELRCFARDRLASYFPDLADLDAVDRVLAEDVDANALLAATRLEGAPDPCVVATADVEGAPVSAPAVPPAPRAEESVRALTQKAEIAAAKGNLVAAALIRQSLVHLVPAGERQAAQDAADAELAHLLNRFGHALQIPANDLEAWREPLIALLVPAAADFLPIEARFLYDLQNVCIDREREVYALDLVEWFVSWGHRPVKRLLPNQPLILAVKHLHTALHRVTGVRIAEPLRLRLVQLMTAAVHHGEQQVRERFRPVIQQALDKVGLKAENFAERIGRDKLVEELLDRVVERRFLGMGDLRDAIARNQLKLPDLAGVSEFFLGDKLIRANRQFADDLDGVYRRGEIYLRWLQRLSSSAFGTRVGRFLTLFLVLPLAGSYLSLEALHHIIEIFHTHHMRQPLIAGMVGLAAAPEQGPLVAVSTLAANAHGAFHLVNVYSVGALAIFLFAVLHVPWFRHVVVMALTQAWHGTYHALFEWPAAFLRLRVVRYVLDSWPCRLFYQLALKPLPWAAGSALMCRLLRLGPEVALAVGTGVFLAASVLYNSRFGQNLEELITDRAVSTWEHVSRNVVPGLYRMVLFLFKRLLGDLERVLYAVDELLRFRAGDSRFSLVWKPVLGLVWFFVTYLIRLFINLFVEPTFNPIKHFPVVTVTAKLIVPIIKPLSDVIVDVLTPLGVPAAAAYTVAGFVIFFLPGLAGFLVWELKENWRLYRSNRPATLEPVVVGSHGETVARLLRPGLHSGTVPKLYARLRRKHGTAAHTQHEALHHVEERLRYFVERDLLAVLAGSKRWAGLTAEVGQIRLGTNRIRFELRCPALSGDNVCLDFEERAGLLHGGITLAHDGFGASWLARLQPPQTAALQDALVGIMKMAGVDAAATVAFADVPVAWTDWVQTWELDQAGNGQSVPLLRGMRLVPASLPS